MHGKLPETKAKPKSWARRIGRWLVSLLVLAAVGGALYYVYHGSPAPQRRVSRYATSGPIPVLVATAARADVPVYLTTVGTVKALNTVTVSPQVDGKLLSVNFKEGQDVKKGDVLAKIDPTIYQAQYDQAVAKKAQDEAQLANAKIDLARYEKLAATNAINKQQADTQRALVAQDEALVQADQATIENVQATLSYTTVTAPISGRTGIRQIDEGNIVRAASSPAIVVITQLQPISVIFNLPQQDIQQVNDAFSKGPLEADALSSDNNKVIDKGTLTVIDNQVDATTGTVKLKAEFPNAKLQLWPGEFVNVQLLIDTLKNVVVIPTGAVQRGPNGTFVYVVGSDDKVAMRQIVVQRQDENQAVIKSGVAPPDVVVTTGFASLTDGSKVAIAPANPPPTATPATGSSAKQPANATPAKTPAGPQAAKGKQRQHNGTAGKGTGTGQQSSGANQRPAQ
jgi:membrane fusion protein, multidrug efflux system